MIETASEEESMLFSFDILRRGTEWLGLREFPKVTIKDVAKYADVGVGTVSRVLNNNSHVDPSTTRQRVLSAMKELGYVPNHARRLSTGTSDLVTVIH